MLRKRERLYNKFYQEQEYIDGITSINLIYNRGEFNYDISLLNKTQGVFSWSNGKSDVLRNRSKRVRTPVALLSSNLDKYPWERFEPPYPPSYGLNSTTTVLLGEWLRH